MKTTLKELIGNKLLEKHESLYISTITGVRKIMEVDSKTLKVTCFYSRTSKRKIFKCNMDTAVFNAISRAERYLDKVK